MSAEITMPQLSDTMTEGTVVKWHKKEGDKIKAGEEIVSAGQLKLHNGSPIVVDNTIKPSDSAHPTPPNE